MLEDAKSVAHSLYLAANGYAEEFEKKLLSFNFSPIEPKTCAMNYYAFIDALNPLLEKLALISERASGLYNESIDSLEQINLSVSRGQASLSCPTTQKLLELTREKSRESQKILALAAKISEAHARFTLESEPLIIAKEPSANKIATSARKYATALMSVV